MQLNRIDTVLIKSLYLFAVLIAAAQVLGIKVLTSPLFYMTFLLVAALWVSAAREMKTNDYIVLAAIILAGLCVYSNALVTNTSLSFSYLRKLIIFSCTLLLFGAAGKLRVDHEIVRWISTLMTVVTAVFIFGFLFRHDQMFLLNGRVVQYLTLGFTNPNLTGMVLVCLLVYQFAGVCADKKVVFKLIHIVFFCVLCYFLYLTQARNSLLTAVIFVGLAVAARFMRFHRSYRMRPLLSMFIAWWPLIFAWLYMQIVHARWLTRLLSAFISEGKLLSSRVRIWSQAMELFLQSPVSGIYSQTGSVMGVGHLHNTHLEILCHYGVPVLILTCWLIQRCLQRCEITSYAKSIFLIGFVCVVILGMGEAALFSGGLSMYIIGLGTLFMANAEELPIQPEAQLPHEN